MCPYEKTATLPFTEHKIQWNLRGYSICVQSRKRSVVFIILEGVIPEVVGDLHNVCHVELLIFIVAKVRFHFSFFYFIPGSI